MTFFIPPVFLFGNNANRFHNNEEEKSEYKTAAETEIKVENWRVKRITELEKENKKLNEKIDKLQDEYDELYIEKCNASNQWKCCEAENKELKDELLTYMRK